MKSIYYTLCIWALTLIMGSCSYNKATFDTPEHLNISQLQGVWYEIASLPARESDECHCVTLEIDVDNKDHMIIRNQCLMGEEGDAKFAEAYVDINHQTRQGKLDLHYNKLNGTPYWVVDIEENLQDKYLVLAHPSGEYLWLLAREASITSEEYWTLRDAITGAGFDTELFAATDQSCYGGWVETGEPAQGDEAVK